MLTSPIGHTHWGGIITQLSEDFLVVISKLLSQGNLVYLEVRVQLETSMTTHILLYIMESHSETLVTLRKIISNSARVCQISSTS